VADTPAIAAARNAALVEWFRRSARPLPWRVTTDPYRILVSEVMLQQTQAERVAPYFERFIEVFPTAEALAAASLDEVLRLWSGLGYNSRAKRLRDAAAAVAADGWPRDVEGLQRLPGVGPYTARAVAAFSFGERVAAVDTNLRRVLSRWHGAPLAGIGLAAAAERELGDDAAEWNQAMMDLGAQLCRPRSPACGECPVEAWCAGPETYVAPRPQGRFEGSPRQVRGAVVRQLIERPASLSNLVRATGFDPTAVEQALDDLGDEGVVEPNGAEWMISS
jgi:A/G-specific adenine glycosylase